MSEIVQKLLAGQRLALSRLITLVENGSEKIPQYLSEIHASLGKAYYLGVTGPPGAGKSTLVNRLIAQARSQGLKVGVVAIDPSSPFSGGALLGDRIRMQDHAADADVFIRSLATRGAHGGLSRSTRDVVRLMDAFGMDWVIIETVGVGQTELDIMELGHSTVVVLTPESGDTIQTMKAGLLEVADLFVVNKADREGADKIVHELQAMIEMSPPKAWKVPVLKTQAAQNIGLEALLATLQKHRDSQSGPGDVDRLRQVRQGELEEILQETFVKYLRKDFFTTKEHASLWEPVLQGRISAYQGAEAIFKKIIVK